MIWTHEEVKSILEKGTIADLERLIADPGRAHRQEIASSYTIAALKDLAQSEVLPDDIRTLVQRILTLYEIASDPSLGTNLSTARESE